MQASRQEASTRGEILRGLPVALSATVGAAFGLLGLTLYTLPFFVAPLHAEFGWKTAAIPIAMSFYTAAVLLTGPIYGRLCDRFGARRVVPWSILSLVLGYAGMTLVHGSVWNLYAAYAALAVIGGGTAYGAYGRVLATWFRKSRGLAFGLMMAGPAFVAIGAPLILPDIIHAYGWRGGMFCLAAAALIPLPLALLFVREREAVAGPEEDGHIGFPLSQSLRTRRFWTMAVAFACVSTGIVGVHLHIVPMITELGASKALVLKTASVFGVGVLVGRLVIGALLDRVPGHLLGAALFAVPAVGLLLLVFGGVSLAYPFALMLGLAAGAETDVGGYLVSRYFGLKAYAETFGWLFGAMAFGSAVGPLVMGALLTRFGGYQAPLIASACLCLTGAALFLTLGRYATPAELAAGAPET